jgi:hypothetical protein
VITLASRIVLPGDILAAFIHVRPSCKDDHEAKQRALALIDWAILECDKCPDDKLAGDSNRALTKRK